MVSKKKVEVSSSSESSDNSDIESSSSYSSEDEKSNKKRKTLSSSESESESNSKKPASKILKVDKSSSESSSSSSSSESESSSSESEESSSESENEKKLKKKKESKSDSESESESSESENKMKVDKDSSDSESESGSDSDSSSEDETRDDKSSVNGKDILDEDNDHIDQQDSKVEKDINIKKCIDDLFGTVYGKNGNDIPLNTVYPNRKRVQNLSEEEKNTFIDKTSVLSTRLLLLIRNTLSLQMDDKSSLSLLLHQLSFGNTSNINNTPHQQQQQQQNSTKEPSLAYSDLSLWKDIQKNNQNILKQNEHLIENNNNNNSNNNNNNNNSKTKQQQQQLNSIKQTNKNFRDFFVDKMTNEFGDDIDKLRDDPNYKDSMLTMLLEGMESGIDIYSLQDKQILLQQQQQKQK
ncbi:hypothetical protein DLAC_07723 [Tieghemostelium lacteum]|uniref:Ribosome assembly protein 3 n=1 Tax=Tieghemostelium lacteum TaxID=361077 RepID=A0A151ZA81_TIELA|nr:hypothetical protein DLAC_07723 [Tieghemostelium lacteum]|eukprot:KYQ90852.1 hypothetical protein DLAC_07723 [Tieghemostelium lacteum]